MTNAASYIRVSSTSQTGADRDGFHRQDKAVAKYCEANALEYAVAFVEFGVCGDTDVNGREALPDLLAHAANGGPKVVVIESPDRLARSLVVGEVILSKFQGINVQVVSASSGSVLTSDAVEEPERVMIRQMMAVFAQFDKNKLILRMREGQRRKKLLTGRCAGSRPYGLWPEKHPDEPDVLALMRSLEAGEWSAEQIASELNRRGIKTRHGAEWLRQGVAAVLKRLPHSGG